MAMLPPLLVYGVEDPTVASIFVQELAADLQEGGLNVAADDLGGTVTAPEATSEAASEPAMRPARPQWLRLTDEQRAQIARGRPCATICQPVVIRYGYYPAYVGGRYIGEGYGRDDFSSSRDHYGDRARFGGSVEVTLVAEHGGGGGGERGGGFAERGGERGEFHGGREGFGMHEHGREGRFGGFGWWGWAGDYDYEYYYPPHYEPAAQVVIAFHIFDAASGRMIYYIRASSGSFSHDPSQLEKRFRKPVVKAFRQAMGLPN
jgi:hypothetical protein